MTIRTNAAGALLWSRRYDATTTNNEVPEWVTVDGANAVYVAPMGGPSPTTGNVSFLEPVTLKYDAAGDPVWVTVAGGNAQVTVDGGRVFTLETGQMTSVRFDQAVGSDPPPPPPPPPPPSLGAPANLTAGSTMRRRITLTGINTATSATSISVERCLGSTCTAFGVVAGLAPTATAWTDTGVRSGSTYRYRVRAANAVVTSAYSNVASATAR